MITEAEIAAACWQIWREEDRGQTGRANEYWRTVELSLEQHEVAGAAWEIWEKEGRQDGRALEYWTRAEQQVLAARQQGSSRTNGATPSRAAPAPRANGAPATGGDLEPGLSKRPKTPPAVSIRANGLERAALWPRNTSRGRDDRAEAARRQEPQGAMVLA